MMSQENTLLDRLTDMECKYSFQQKTIDALNEQVTKQWSVIDKLRLQLERMTEQVTTLEDHIGDPHNEPPPPHY